MSSTSMIPLLALLLLSRTSAVPTELAGSSANEGTCANGANGDGTCAAVPKDDVHLLQTKIELTLNADHAKGARAEEEEDDDARAQEGEEDAAGAQEDDEEDDEDQEDLAQNPDGEWSMKVKPAIDYFRHWASGRVAHSIEMSLEDPEEVSLAGVNRATTATGISMLLDTHRMSVCPEAALQSEASWSLHGATVDAAGVQHGLLRSPEGSLQYVAEKNGRLLAADPPACPKLSLYQEDEPELTPVNGTAAEAGEGHNLDPATDPMVQDCLKLFHRTVKHVCSKDYDVTVLSAITRIIDGFDLEMVIKIRDPAGKETFHNPTCDFEVSSNKTDAKLLEVEEIGRAHV